MKIKVILKKLKNIIILIIVMICSFTIFSFSTTYSYLNHNDLNKNNKNLEYRGEPSNLSHVCNSRDFVYFDYFEYSSITSSQLKLTFRVSSVPDHNPSVSPETTNRFNFYIIDNHLDGSWDSGGKWIKTVSFDVGVKDSITVSGLISNHYYTPVIRLYHAELLFAPAYWGTTSHLDSFKTLKKPKDLVINSVEAIALAPRKAKINYQIDVPLLSADYEATKIYSIKVFFNEKEIAQASNTNSSGTIQIDKLSPGHMYTFELRVNSNVGIISKTSNRITTFEEEAKLPMIRKVNATTIGAKIAKINYSILIINDSNIYAPTIINSIKVFNDGKEIAQASNTNSSGTIQINNLIPSKDYIFELRVYSNAGEVRKMSNKITTLSEDSPQLQAINVFVAMATSKRSAVVYFEINVPTDSFHKPTIIESIKVFTNGRKVADAPVDLLSNSIQINGLDPDSDYIFELRVYSNAGMVIKKSNKVTT